MEDLIKNRPTKEQIGEALVTGLLYGGAGISLIVIIELFTRFY